MGSGWHEWPLVIFTVLGQCVAGAVIVVGAALLSGALNDTQRRSVERSMIVLWVLMGIAFIASVAHLGSPLRAFNSLNRIGQSGLSNEIAGGSLFFAVGGFWWLLTVINRMPAALGRVWLVATMVLGVVFVWLMSRVYSTIDTIPTWNTVWTPVGFFLTMLIGGPLLGYLLLRAGGVKGRGLNLLPVVSLVALVVSMVAITMQSAALPGISSSVAQASALVPDYGMLIALRVVLLAAALALWIVPQFRGQQPGMATLSVAFLMVLVGEFIGRGIFYGLHMTVGMAIAG